MKFGQKKKRERVSNITFCYNLKGEKNTDSIQKIFMNCSLCSRVMCYKIVINYMRSQSFFNNHAPRHVGSQSPDHGSNPWPLHWKHRVLTTGSPGKSLDHHLYETNASLSKFCLPSFTQNFMNIEICYSHSPMNKHPYLHNEKL